MAHPICRGVGGAAMWLSLLVALAVCAMAPKADARAQAPGAPGDPHTWAPADKHGFGTATDARQQRLVHASRRGAERGLLPGPRDPEPARARVRRHRRAHLPRSRDRRRSEGAGAAGRGLADLPPDHRDAPLATDQDLDLGPAGRQRARRRALRLPDGEAAGALRARRPGARRRRQRRSRPAPRRRAARPRRHGRQPDRGPPGARQAVKRLRRDGQRSVAGPARRQGPRRLVHGRPTRQRRPGRPHEAHRAPRRPPADAGDRLRCLAERGRPDRRRRARPRLRPGRAALRRRLAGVPRLAQRAAGERRRGPAAAGASTTSR